MNEINFAFRPMPNLNAGIRIGTLRLCGAFIEIETVNEFPIYLAPHAALAMSNALREAYNEAREASRGVLR